MHNTELKRCKGVDKVMSTGSIKHNVVIKDRKSAKAFMEALEKSAEYKDCLACSNSFSEEGQNENPDRLFCVVHQKYVEENNSCNDFN